MPKAIVTIYKPIDGAGVSVEGIRVPKEGFESVGKHPKLDKWVGKVLKVEAKDAEVAATEGQSATELVPPETHGDEPDINLDEVALITKEAAEALGIRALRKYASQFDIKGKSFNEIVGKLKKANKLATE